jgi:hypothetical protein
VNVEVDEPGHDEEPSGVHYLLSGRHWQIPPQRRHTPIGEGDVERAVKPLRWIDDGAAPDQHRFKIAGDPLRLAVPRVGGPGASVPA